MKSINDFLFRYLMVIAVIPAFFLDDPKAIRFFLAVTIGSLVATIKIKDDLFDTVRKASLVMSQQKMIIEALVEARNAENPDVGGAP